MSLNTRFKPWNHPLRQANLYSQWPLYPWQRKILVELAKPRSRVVVSTCNESGKTSTIIPIFGLSVMTAFPGATVFSTAGAEEQVRGQLFKYLQGILRPWTVKDRNDDTGWFISESGLYVRGPRIRGLQSRWIARVPKDALTMEGYHSGVEPDEDGEPAYCPVCVIVDEAKSTVQKVWEAIHRINPDWALAISTPAADSGPFFENMDPDTLVEVA